jgi:hypothetical protein
MRPTLTPELRTKPHRRPAVLSAGLVVLWLASAAAGFGLLMRHQMTPGSAGQPAHTLPEVLSTPPLGPATSNARPRLVVVAHPPCPCTAVTLEQLRPLLGRSDQPATGTQPLLQVVLVVPDGAPAGFERGRIMLGASTLPGAITTVLSEAQARNLGIRTSGHVLLYAATGELLFSGGITQGRGHAGDNPGLTDLTSTLRGGRPARSTHLVYGCPLLSDDACGTCAPPPAATAATASN